eukprot:382555_1
MAHTVSFIGVNIARSAKYDGSVYLLVILSYVKSIKSSNLCVFNNHLLGIRIKFFTSSIVCVGYKPLPIFNICSAYFFAGILFFIRIFCVKRYGVNLCQISLLFIHILTVEAQLPSETIGKHCLKSPIMTTNLPPINVLFPSICCNVLSNTSMAVLDNVVISSIIISLVSRNNSANPVFIPISNSCASQFKLLISRGQLNREWNVLAPSNIVAAIPVVAVDNAIYFLLRTYANKVFAIYDLPAPPAPST